MKTRAIFFFALLISLGGCIKETLDECPTGNVRVHVYVEKFQTDSESPTQDIEASFRTRIQYFHCLLYKDNQLVSDTVIPETSGVQQSSYTWEAQNLEFGDYQLLIIANSDPATSNGDLSTLGEYYLVYPGTDQTQDFFATTLPFTVNCDCLEEYHTKLRRLQGVVRCVFNNLPAAATEVEFSLQNLSSKAQLGKKQYTGTTDVSKRIPIPAATSASPFSVVIGTFPTPENQTTTYAIKLYSNAGSSPIYDQVVNREVKIQRNQLNQLITNFSSEGLSFEVIVNQNWDDVVNSDGGILP